MGTRFSVSVSYGGDGVGIEIDVYYQTPKEYDPGVNRWRNPDGSFASAPDVTDVTDLERVGRDVKENIAAEMRTKELRDAVADADLTAVEDGELVGGVDREGFGNVTRIDSDGDGEVDHRYNYTQGRLREF